MNDNFVKSLREKTEEADLDTILKKSFGGYSRKSVLEYISMMRQQQYDMQQSFSEKLQLSQSDRDRLARELAQANERANAAEDALERGKPLMEKAAALEKDMDEAVERIRGDAVRLEQQRLELERIRSERDDLRTRLEQANTETDASKPESAQQEREVLQPGSSVQEPKMTPSADSASLVEWPEAMHLQLSLLSQERKSTAKQLESFLRQEKRLFHALNQCWGELENRLGQNQCMEAENKDLGRRLSEQMWENIALNREIVHMRTINDNLKRKLDRALEKSAKDNTPIGSQDAGDVFLWNFEN